MEKIQIDYKSDIVPIEKWSKDHYSTLAYAESRVVDYRGFLDNRHMRCDARLHLKMATQYTGGGKYPTRLKNNEEAINHDDFSCLEDFQAYGLLKEEQAVETETRQYFRPSLDVANKRAIYGWLSLQIQFTPLGLELCSELRTHKATGGSFGNFEPSEELLNKIKNNLAQSATV